MRGASGDVSAPTAAVPPPAIEGRPLVSVLVPAFNGAGVVEQTLRSILGQTFRPLELVVIDDASEDSTADAVLASLAVAPVPSRLVRHDTNAGLSKTLNHGLRETSGDLVLIVHQDVVLASPDWIERAVQDLEVSPRAAVVTGDYGVPAASEIDFAQRVFGVLRRQFHRGPGRGIERATFTEFKCDLARRAALESIGGFPERFRIAGEDLWVSYSLRDAGAEILKDFALRSVQRFTGDATSVRGNLRKEFLFGKVLAGTLLRFRSGVARGLGQAAYSRSRSWHRAAQPAVVTAAVVLLVLAGLTRSEWAVLLLIALVLARLGYYAARLWPDLRWLDGSAARTLKETVAGAFVGLASDVWYSSGLLVGLVRWSRGSTV